MFTKSAAFYDALYSFKNYAGEAERLHAVIEQHRRIPGNTLLDVACGTGKHLAELRRWYVGEGLDLDAGLLAIAREANPEAKLHQADMLDFDLKRQFDVVTCLFSSVGYMRTVPRLREAVVTMARHVALGGVLMIEPWIFPEKFTNHHVSGLYVDQPELKVARFSVTEIREGISVLDFNYLVATPAGVEHFTERHELGMFAREDYESAMSGAGLEVTYDPEGLMGRGLFIGVN